MDPHPLLRRQLKRLGDSLPEMPATWQPFLTAVDEAYKQADADLQLIEKALDITSKESSERYEKLLHQNAALQSSQHALQLTQVSLDFASDPVFWNAPSGRLIYVNNAACDVLGWTREELLTKSISDIDPSMTLEKWPQTWELLKQRGRLALESNHRSRDGRIFPVSITANYNQLEGHEYGCSFVRDLTELRRMAVLEQERLGLTQAVASMEHVLGVVSHELRTPIAGCRAMTELIIEMTGDPTSEMNTMLGTMLKEIVRMSDTVNNILEAARLNSGRATWNWSTFELHGVCVAAIEPISPNVEADKVKLTVEVIPENLSMNGDPDAIRRLIMNLVANAARYTRIGTIRVSISKPPLRPGWIQIQVNDTGCGMSQQILDRLGEAFALNAGVVGANHVGGTGLGVAICKGIVAAHGGEFTVRSQEGCGTDVTIFLQADLPGPVIASADSWAKAA